METKFNPNAMTFEQGEEKVRQASKEAHLKIGDKIITSRDAHAITAVNLLSVDNIPGGFKKWQLPFVMERSQLFISVGSPDSKVPEHSHDEGDGIRFIMSGSIHYNGMELTGGDWMYIPKGVKYSFRVGPLGVAMCYCYCCCCAGTLNLNHGDLVINPIPMK
ncbi:MAG: cupin domain-containing protein [Ginsengibacter sp.]